MAEPKVTTVLINNSTNDTVLTGSTVFDIINNSGRHATINAGGGDDLITNNGYYASINGDADNDSIVNNSYYATISGGKGNDTVYAGYESVIKYASGDGNDVIYNFNANDTLNITSGTIDSYYYSGSDYVIKVGSGAVTLKSVGTIPIQVLDASGKLSVINYGISNSASNTVVNGGAGADTISNTRGTNVTINAGAGNDKVHNNYGNSARINLGDGNDSVYNTQSSKVSIYGGEGADTVYNNNGASMTAELGAGTDYVTNYGQYSKIDAGADNDTVYNYAMYSTINAGEGKNYVYNNSSYSSVNAGAGNDSIYNYYGSYSTVNAGAGNDSIYNYNSDRSTINAGDGNDTIYNYDMDGGAVNAGAGNDSISGSHWYVALDAGAGNDTISGSFYSTSTIRGGTGNDYINASGSYRLFQYANGDGSDTITNFSIYDTINITSGTIASKYYSGSDYLVNIGSGSVLFKNVGYNPIQLRDASGSLYAVNYGQSNYTSSKTMTGTSANDSLYNNYASYATINSAAGNDTIYNYYGSYAKINAGDGADFIYNYYGSYESISGGAGNDSIYAYGSYNTVNGGTGNDRIWLSSKYNNVVQYAAGDGNDIVYGFDNTDTLQITKGSLTSYIYNGSSYILTIGDGTNSGTVTLSGITSYLPIQVRDANGNTRAINYSTSNYAKTVVSGTSGVDSISNHRISNATVNADGGNDVIFNNYAYYASINADDGADTVYNDYGYYSTINAGAGNDSVYNYYGSSSSINGGDGNDTVYNYYGSNVSIDAGAGADRVTNYGSSAKINLGAGNDTIYNSSSATINGGTGNDSVYNSYSTAYIDAGDGNDTIHNYSSGSYYGTLRGGAGNDTIYNISHYAKIYGDDDNDTITNSGQYATVDGGTGNDSIYNSGYRATIFGGDGNDSLNNNASYVSLDAGDGNDTIYNTASYATVRGGDGNDTIRNSGSISLLEGGKGNDTLISTVGATLVGGKDNDTITGSSQMDIFVYAQADGHDTITNYDPKDVIYIADASDYSIVSDGTNTTIHVYAVDTVNNGTITLLDVGNPQNIKISQPNVEGPVYLVNRNNDSLVSSGEYNDTIENYGTNVTVDGGKGDDIYMNKSTGSQTTLFGGEGNDKFTNDAAFASVNGGVGTDSIVNNGTDSTMIGGEGNDTVTNNGTRTIVDGGAGNDRIINYSGSNTLYGGVGVDTVQNSGTANVIFADLGNDLIIDSGSFNTLDGGAGNDSFSLASGHSNAVINYSSGDGNDTVYGFKATDTLKVTGDVYNTVVSGSDLIVSVGSGTITLKDAASITPAIDGVWDDPNKFINNTLDNTLLATADGRDTIINSGANVTITSGNGVDIITNSGSKTTINAGAGANTISNSGTNSTILGGNDDDYISNNAQNVNINSGDGNDTVKNSASQVTIATGAGNDSVFNTAQQIKLDTGDGNDTIYNYNANRSTVNAGAGDDSIYDYSNYGTVLGGDGNDFITINGAWTTVYGGDGNDTITGSDEYMNGGKGNDVIYALYQTTTVEGGEGNDLISLGSGHSQNLIQYANGDGNDTVYGFNGTDTLDISGVSTYSTMKSGDNDILISVGSGSILLKDAAAEKQLSIFPTIESPLDITNSQSDTTIKTYSFDDTITNYADNVTIDSGAGNDLISNYGAHVSVNAGTDNDTVRNSGDNSIIDGGNGDDYLHNQASNSTLLGGAGNDTFFGADSDTAFVNVLFNGGAGADSFDISSENSTVLGGDGNDTIYNYGNGNLVDAGAGNDYVFNYGENASVYGSADADYIENDGDNAIVNGGDGANYIGNSGSNATLLGGSDNDAINNYASSAAIDAGAGADTVQNFGESSTVNGGNGNDIINNYGSLSAIDAGNDDDYIFNTAARVSINAGAGNDTIVNSGDDATGVTIRGGSGNDLIQIESTLQANVIEYFAGDGSDIIQNFGESDTLLFSSDVTVDANGSGVVGDDYVIKVNSAAGSDSIVMQGLANYHFTVVGGALTITTVVPETYEVWETEIVNNKSSVRVNPANLDESYSEEFVGYYQIKNTGDNVIVVSGSGNDSIYNDNSDSGLVLEFNALSGNDIFAEFSANDTIKIDERFGEISTSYVKGDDFVIILKNDIEGGTATLKLQGAATLASAIRFAADGKTKYLTVDGITTTINRTDKTQVTGTDGRDYIINTGAGVTINGGAGDDTIYGSDNGERFQVAATDGNDLITNFGKNDTLQLRNGSIASSIVSGNDVIFNLKNGSHSSSITLQGAAEYKFNKSGSLLTVDQTNQLVNSNDDVKFNGTSDKDYITNSGANVTIQAGKGNDTIEGSNFGDVFAFGAGDGNDIIVNFDVNDTLAITSGSITGGSIRGDDYIVTVARNSTKNTITLKNAAGFNWNQTATSLTVDDIQYIDNTDDGVNVTGTGGADFIVNTGANVTIRPGRGNDTIIGSDSYGDVFAFAAIDGNNIIPNVRENDTLKAISGTISAVETSGDDLIATVSSASYNSIITLGGAAEYQLIQNTSVIRFNSVNNIVNGSDGVKVTGTGGRDYIINTGENVTVQPGKGNDTIEGSNFAELYTFAYNSGNNVITNFGAGDSIKSTSGTLSYAKSDDGNDIIVSITKSGTTSKTTLQGAGGYDFVKSGNTLYFNNFNTIENDKSKKIVKGTGGADFIVNTGENVTIQSNAGNDTITGSDTYGEVFSFAYTAGQNVITNFGDGDTLRASSGTLTYEKSGDDVIVSITKGKTTSTITLQGAAALQLKQSGRNLVGRTGITQIVNSNDDKRITGTDDDDMIVNTGDNVTIQPNGGNDTITGSDDFGETFIFNGIDGNDVITNFSAGDILRIDSRSTVQSAVVGGGNFVITVKQGTDTGTVTLKDVTKIKRKGNEFILESEPGRIINRADNQNVTGTAFDDVIINTGDGATLNGRGGNDTLTGSAYGEVFQFASDGGNDLITGFGEEDTLQITGGKIQSSIVSGNDVIVNVKSGVYSGSITLGDAAGYVFNKIDTDDGEYLTVERVNYVINRDDNVKVTGTGGADYITNSGNGVTVQAGAGDDTIDGSNFGEVFAFAYNSGANVITNFGANDTLQMTSGKTMSYAAVESDCVVTIASGTKKSTVTLKGAAEYSFRQDGKALVVNNINVINNAQDKQKLTGTANSDYIINSGAKVTVQAGQGNDTIVGSDTYGELFNAAATDGDDVIVNFSKGDTLQAVSGTLKYAVNGNDVIATITSGKKNATVTLTDAAALLDQGYTFIQSGKKLTLTSINEIVNGYDNITVTGTAGRDYIYNSGQGVSIAGGKGNDTIEGSMFAETYLFAYNSGANIVTDFGINDTLKATSGTLSTAKSGDDMIVTIAKGTKKSTVTLEGAGSYNFTTSGTSLFVAGINEIENAANGVKLTGTGGADFIVNTGENVTIQPNAGNDTITGSDEYGERFEFAYTYGNNVITNFGKNDTLRMTSGKTMTYAASGSDYIVTIASGTKKATVTLEGAADLGTIQKSKDGKSLILRTASSITLNELPSSAEDYWFTEDEAIAASTSNEVDALMSEAEVDTSLGKLTFNSEPSDVLTTLDDATKFDRTLSIVERKKLKK